MSLKQSDFPEVLYCYDSDFATKPGSTLGERVYLSMIEDDLPYENMFVGIYKLEIVKKMRVGRRFDPAIEQDGNK